MTVVGKILVFLNLVFSLVVGGFAVVDYATRTHWAEAYNKLASDNSKLRGDVSAFKNLAEQAAKEKADLYEKLTAQRVAIDPTLQNDPNAGARIAENALAELRERARIIDELKVNVESLRKQLADEKARNVTLLNMERAMSTDRDRRTEDTKVLRATLKAEMDKNFRLEQEKNQMRDDMVTAQIAAKALKDRNTQMEEQIQELARTLAQLKSSAGAGGVAGRGANPPPENIEGQVTRADGNLVSLSVGGDNGLAKGQTLEIFRLGAQPRYIGRVKIVEVAAKTSVGQLVGKPTLPVQAGDKAASRIMGGY